MTRYASTIRTAVIPAAGLGTRFLPYTKSQPKEMLPLISTPAIQYVVEEALRSGVDRIYMIANEDKGAIRTHFEEARERLNKTLQSRGKHDDIEKLERISEMGDHITYLTQPRPNGLGGAVLCAKRWVDEPFALLLGDDIIKSKAPATRQLLQVYDKARRPVIAIESVEKERVSSYGIVDLGKKVRGIERAHHVKGLVEKPKASEAPSNMAIVGRYVLEPSIFGYLEGLRERNGEIQLTDALQRSLDHINGNPKGIVAYEFEGKRVDTGTPESWLEANIDMALEDPEMGPKVTEFIRRKVA